MRYDNVYFSNASEQSENSDNEMRNRIKLLKNNIKTQHLNSEEHNSILELCCEYSDLLVF